MTAENSALNAYSTVLTDLRAQREKIDQAIRLLESLSGGEVSPEVGSQRQQEPDTVMGSGAFLGMSIADAAKKLLSIRKQAMNNADIATALREGGLVMSNNTDHHNIVGSVLSRRFLQVGDIVKVGRGVWGLKEWYPNRSFKPGAKNGDQTKSGTNELAQPLEPEDAVSRG